MAFRIHDYVVRGEIDNRIQGIVTGKIWLLGRAAPLLLTLSGNPLRDLAGCKLEFSNPFPSLAYTRAVTVEQAGCVGDMTASRKTRIPDVPVEEMFRLAQAGNPYPWHWGNSLYLEWISRNSGHIIIESSDYKLTVSAPSWEMAEAEEIAQCATNAKKLIEYMRGVVQVFGETIEKDGE